MDAQNVKIGVCEVKLAGTSIGHTEGGVVFSYEPEYQDVTVDQYGKTPVDKVLIGETVKVTVPFAESTLANFNRAMPATTITNQGLAGGANAGKRLSASAVELTLHPVAEADATKDIKIYKAVAHSTIEVGFKNDEERVYEVEFIALIDETKDEGNRLFEFFSIAV